MKIVVIGGGIAGTAAALSARARGADVEVLCGAPGASVIATGVLDFELSDRLNGDVKARALSGDEQRIFDSLGAYAIGAERCVVAHSSGVVRSAGGRDRAILDLASLQKCRVMVPFSEHPRAAAGKWLAQSWGASAFARARGVEFVGIEAELSRIDSERSLDDAEMAELHASRERLGWLASRLREALATAGPGLPIGAVVMPPWLGIGHERATELSALVGVPCGEHVGGVGGAAGRRFEAARDAAFKSTGIQMRTAWAKRITPFEKGWRVECEQQETRDADAVIVASGGLIGGGLEYKPGEVRAAAELAEFSPTTFHSTIQGDFIIGMHGRPQEIPGSSAGIAPESLAWPFETDPTLEKSGILMSPHGEVLNAKWLFAAGDVTSDRPKTWLEAFVQGVSVGTRAATR